MVQRWIVCDVTRWSAIWYDCEFVGKKEDSMGSHCTKCDCRVHQNCVRFCHEQVPHYITSSLVTHLYIQLPFSSWRWLKCDRACLLHVCRTILPLPSNRSDGAIDLTAGVGILYLGLASIPEIISSRRTFILHLLYGGEERRRKLHVA